MSLKILVVDDEPDEMLLITQQFEEKILDGTFVFIFANNGAEALEKLHEHSDIEIVLTDINMPVMDGISLLIEITKFNPLIKTVMVSAYSDMQNIRKAMNIGAFDFVTKPIDFDDLKLTLSKTIEAIENLKISLKDHVELIDIQNELKIAKKIQEEILPHNFVPIAGNNRFEVFGKTIPARLVGGDFFDFYPLSSNMIAIVIADVSGKGVPAALFMAIARTAIRCFSSPDHLVTETICKANRFLCEENESVMFVTLFYAVLNTDTGELNYVNAGHNPPIMISEDAALTEIGRYEGTPLGVDEGAEYISHRIIMKKNDFLFCYTDGVTEALDDNRNLFSEQRLHSILKESSGLPISETIDLVIDRINQFKGKAEQSDDITILCLRYLNGQ